jgi:hypothetical protein
MSTIGIVVGAEGSERAYGFQDPSSTLRLSALAASWTAFNGHTVLTLGDAPALLAVGTAVLGLQQGRVLEGGERRKSPVRVLALLASEYADRDRSLSFRRPGRETVGDERVRQQTPEEEQQFGDLSLLIDLGIMDLVGHSQLSLEPQSASVVAKALGEQLFSERPRAILAIGAIPDAVSQIVRGYSHDTESAFASILSDLEGAERLTGSEQIPMLNGRRIRLRDRGPSPEEADEDVYDTVDKELMHAAQQATWEAEMTFRMYQWLTSIAQ